MTAISKPFLTRGERRILNWGGYTVLAASYASIAILAILADFPGEGPLILVLLFFIPPITLVVFVALVMRRPQTRTRTRSFRHG